MIDQINNSISTSPPIVITDMKQLFDLGWPIWLANKVINFRCQGVTVHSAKHGHTWPWHKGYFNTKCLLSLVYFLRYSDNYSIY